MAKKHKNLDNIPVQWDGDVIQPSDGSTQSTPDNIDIVWGSNPYTWGDVNFIIEIADGIGTGSRRARQDRLNKILDDEDKKKRIIQLICRVKGEKVFDEDIEVKDVQVNIKDVDMITERVLGKVTMETEDVL